MQTRVSTYKEQVSVVEAMTGDDVLDVGRLEFGVLFEAVGRSCVAVLVVGDLLHDERVC